MLEELRIKVALALFPKTKERELTKREVAELVETQVKGSAGAAEHVHKYLSKFNIPVIKDTELNFGKWHAHLFETPDRNICVVYKRAWLWNFESMFGLPTGTGKGTGINLLLYQYCKASKVEEVFIVDKTGKVWIMELSKLEAYVKDYNTAHEYEGEMELHMPVKDLRPWLVQGL